MDKKIERKTVEVGRKRVPLRKILHNKEIRIAAKALEDFRLQLVEQEFLLGAKIILQIDTYGELIAVAKRPETDNELEKRLEKARIAQEQKVERERKRKIAEVERAKKLEVDRKKNAIESIKRIAQTNNLSAEELADMLKST